jgi:hypothetical protein
MEVQTFGPLAEEGGNVRPCIGFLVAKILTGALPQSSAVVLSLGAGLTDIVHIAMRGEASIMLSYRKRRKYQVG